MKELFYILLHYAYFTAALAALDSVVACRLAVRLRLYLSSHIVEAMGKRFEGRSLYERCRAAVRQAALRYAAAGKKQGFYAAAESRMKKAGYTGEYSAAVYLALKFGAVPLLSVTALILNFPGIVQAITTAAVSLAILETVVHNRRRRHNLVFQKHIYKIYKYLHNQISSGVKVTDAVRGVYEIIEDSKLRDILIQLSARYELTLDIEAALDEFKSNFDSHEADTLCVALKQGIATGDNRELLARQEDVMFKKYFNYIQAETDNCRLRSAAAAAMFTAVIVIMIAVPMIMDVSGAMGGIFAN